MKKSLLIVFLVGVLIFLFFGIYSHFTVREYLWDSISSLIIIVLVLFLRKPLHLRAYSLLLIILALAAHLSGVFGFYNITPISMQYDHFTHFFGLFAVSTAIFHFLEPLFSWSKKNNFLVFMMILFCSLGIGAFVEQVEYVGYVSLGTGPGLFQFGGLGDTPFTEENLRVMDMLGGGWVNAMLDLNYNFLGAFIGTLLLYLIYTFKSKRNR